MAIIVPAILESSEAVLQDKLFAITHISDVERVQIDFVDGVFAPTQTVQVEVMENLNPTVAWEAHVMAKEPHNFFDYKTLGFNQVIVHAESFANSEGLLSALREIKSLAMEAGIALNPDTDLAILDQVKDAISSLTLLGVTPGRQGQGMHTSFIERIAEARRMYAHGILEIDGGVHKENITQFAHAGVDRIVVGSGIFAAGNPAENFATLAALLKAAL